MTYGFSLARQTQSFLVSFGFGFILGILYDIFFIVRLLISKSKTALIISDMLYVAVASVLSFSMFLVVTDGEVRMYVIFGELLGFLVYYFSAGVFVNRVSEKIITFLRRFFTSLFKIISAPFKWIFRFTHKIFAKTGVKIRKMAKKTAKKSKFCLQVHNVLLYNSTRNKINSSFDGESKKNSPSKEKGRIARGSKKVIKSK